LIIAQAIIAGLAEGAVYALPALGISMIWRTQGFPHLAHGVLATLGAYALWVGLVILHLPLQAAVPISIALVCAFGLLIHGRVYRQLRGRPMFSLLMAAIGIDLIVRYGIQAIFGTQLLDYGLPAVRSTEVAGLLLSPIAVITIATAALSLLGVWALFNHSSVGRQMRAVADNVQLAQLAGINVDRIYVYIWVIASGLAAIAGMLLGWRNFLYPNLGWDILLPVFAASLLGGIARPFGAVVGALLMGVTADVGILWLPSGYKPAIAFAVIGLVLLMRPRGLFGLSARV
jgi:branched-subunit amino acid ABC-type transport system permease component